MTSLIAFDDPSASPPRAPGILRATDPSPAAWPRALGRATTLGFDTLLLPGMPPDALIQAARGLGVTLLVDIDVAGLADAADAETLAARCAAHLDGPGGARLLGLDRLAAPILPSFLTCLRALRPAATLFGWTPGVAWATLAAIPPGAVDLVAASLPWWDGRADWLWQELDLLRRIAPVVADAGDHPLRQGFAAVLAEGWMTVETPATEALGVLRRSALKGLPWSRLASPAGGPAYALLRTDAPDPRHASRAALAVTAFMPAQLAASLPLMAAAGGFDGFTGAAGEALLPGDIISLRPNEVQLFTAAARDEAIVPPVTLKDAAAAAAAPRIVIGAVTPRVGDGRAAPRRAAGSAVAVACEIMADADAAVAAALLWRGPDDDDWTPVPMARQGGDRWTAAFPLRAPGLHAFMIEAWPDPFAALLDGPDPGVEHAAPLIRAAAAHSRRRTLATLGHALDVLATGDAAAQAAIIHAPETRAAMARVAARRHRVSTGPVPVLADRAGAGFSAWYRLTDGAAPLPPIQAMGFDVLHLPDGMVNAAVAVAPEPVLALCRAAARHGMELALTFDASPHLDAGVHGGAGRASPERWHALTTAALFWTRHGIRTFHVPDPAVLPLAFWAWMTAAVRSRCPEAVFSAGSSADARAMRRLATAGFTQAATGLGWHRGVPGLVATLTSWTRGELHDAIGPHLAADAAQGPSTGGLIPGAVIPGALIPGALIKVALAATLSGVWSLRQGAEHAEGVAAAVSALNGIRRRHPALRSHHGLTMLDPGNDRTLLFERATHGRENVVLVAISLDPLHPQTARIPHVWPSAVMATDLLRGTEAHWTDTASGAARHVTLTPGQPFALWRLLPMPA